MDISNYNEKSQPWFELRGNLPFHNFLAGPDFWSVSEYKSFITQQSKMGMNFFGLHHYPERGKPESLEGPEPHVWIGHKSDVLLMAQSKKKVLTLLLGKYISN